jgi:hypothetical protein
MPDIPSKCSSDVRKVREFVSIFGEIAKFMRFRRAKLGWMDGWMDWLFSL